MKKLLFSISIITCCFAACKKDPEIKGTRDLKNLSLPQLKSFLNGKWRWQRSVTFTIAGQQTVNNNGLNSYLLFYPSDSIMQIIEDSTTIREKLQYEYLSLPGTGGKSAFIFKWGHNGYDYSNKWVADSLVNDTLLFANYFRSEGVNSYYFTKEH